MMIWFGKFPELIDKSFVHVMQIYAELSTTHVLNYSKTSAREDIDQCSLIRSIPYDRMPDRVE
jgi:hypothetical protein